MLKIIKKNNKLSRVNSIGIGNGCSKHLVEEAAKNGLGTSILLGDNDDI